MMGDFWLWIAAGVTALVIFLSLDQWKQRNTKGPRRWPLVGSAFEMISTFDKQYDWLTEYGKRFPTFEVFYFSIRVIYIVDPVNVEHFLKTNFTNYIKGKIAYDVQREVLGHGIFNTDGEPWRKQRKMASFEFASKNLRDYSCQAFQKYALRLADILVDLTKTNQVVNVYNLFMRLAFDSICEVNFGAEVGTLISSLPEVPLASAFDRCNSCLAQRYWDPTWKIKRYFNVGMEAQLRKDLKILDGFTFKMICNRKREIVEARAQGRGDEKRSDLLSRLLALSEEDPVTFTDKKLRDSILNFAIAGRDSTATSLSWFFYLLSKNPRVEEKLLQEINSVEQLSVEPHEQCTGQFCRECFQRFAKSLSYEILNKLQYLQAAVTEMLRLYPAVPVDGKMAVADDVLPDGTKVRKGDVVNFLPYVMGRMERLWGCDALEFKPERWLEDGVFRPASPFKFTAFQAGPRICLGKDSAYMQIKTTAAVLLRFFHFKLAPNHEPRYRMALILLMSSEGLQMTVHPRAAFP